MPTATKKAAAAKPKRKMLTAAAAKPKRKMLTAAERIAKLEGDLEQARARAKEKGQKRVKQIDEKLKGLVEKRDAVTAEIAELETEKESFAGVEVADAKGDLIESASSIGHPGRKTPPKP